MSNVFDRFRFQGGQPHIPNIVTQFMQARQNPAQIGELLYNTGRITKEQLSDIQGMTSPRQIGEYLMGQSKEFRNMVDSVPHKQQ